MTERGDRRLVEWGPQVLDGSLGVEEGETYYNALEGLTPATRWVWEYDRSMGIEPADFVDVELRLEFTFQRIDENVRFAAEHVGLIAQRRISEEAGDRAISGQPVVDTGSSLPRTLLRHQLTLSSFRSSRRTDKADQ